MPGELGGSFQAKAEAMAQLFHPGDTVMLFYGFYDRRSSSTYEVVRALPASEQDEPQYQVRGPEGYDRVISEGQIRMRVTDGTVVPGKVENRNRRETTYWPPTRAAVTLARPSSFRPLRAAE